MAADCLDPGRICIDKTVITEHGRELGGLGIALYCVLAIHDAEAAESRLGWHHWAARDRPSYAELGRLLGANRQTVAKYMARLRKAGIVAMTPEGDVLEPQYEGRRER